MKLYLVQHGKAESEEVHPDRPLTAEGLDDVRKMASVIGSLKTVTVSAIYYSGKIRAEQTAKIFANHLGEPGMEASDGLSPMDDIHIWADRLLSQTQNIMLVGHLPHLSKLASLLLCGDQDAGIIAFQNAGIACLTRDEYRSWSINWILVPSVA
jgi:phosphohistidine phosphatase